MKRLVLIAILLALGGWQVGEGGWIQGKAWLAQWLLERAWSRTLEGETAAAPWPWADTWPMARLRVPSLGVERIVLEGDSGRTLAFGPGHTPASARPGEAGTVVVSGHRDTHFRFLQQLARGDVVELEGAKGRWSYRVVGASVLDVERHRLVEAGDQGRLLLVTCYPFNALAPGGPLRYVVSAERVKTGSRIRLN
ncbi:class GN sortase [Endothiovibrio diazotrophicus]